MGLFPLEIQIYNYTENVKDMATLAPHSQVTAAAEEQLILLEGSLALRPQLPTAPSCLPTQPLAESTYG